MSLLKTFEELLAYEFLTVEMQTCFLIDISCVVKQLRIHCLHTGSQYYFRDFVEL